MQGWVIDTPLVDSFEYTLDRAEDMTAVGVEGSWSISGLDIK